MSRLGAGPGAGARRAADAAVKHPLRIALIESDELMRALAQRWLAVAGHEVVSVGAGAGAGAAAPGFVLVVVNIPCPRQAGELLCRLQARFGAPMLLVSARLRRQQCSSSTLPCQLGVRGVLCKPFTQRELLEAVARAVAAP
jgi:DNA-binding response OmpR family regulator